MSFFWRGATILTFAVSSVAGCESISKSSRSQGVTKVILLTSPTPLNLDGRPGVDGFPVKLFAFGTSAKPVELQSGKIELVLYDGVVATPLPDDIEPLIVSSYDPDALSAAASTSSIGVGYNLQIRWTADAEVTLIARYVEDAERTIFSAPVSLSVPRPSAAKNKRR